jgi:hypothetical protein
MDFALGPPSFSVHLPSPFLIPPFLTIPVSSQRSSIYSLPLSLLLFLFKLLSLVQREHEKQQKTNSMALSPQANYTD